MIIVKKVDAPSVIFSMPYQKRDHANYHYPMKKILLSLVIIFSQQVFAQVISHQELATKLGYHRNIFENQMLSEEERFSLASYISYDDPLYEDVNGYHRGTTTEFWYFRELSEIDQQIKLMDQSFNKVPHLPKDLVLFRGQTLGYRKDRPFENGEIFTDKAYWSTTTRPKNAEVFAGTSGVLFIVYSGQKKFKGIVLNETENEVLLPRDLTFKVMSTKMKKNLQLALIQICEDKDSCAKEVENTYAATFWNLLR